MSSCTAKMSSRVRSYVPDQRWELSATFTSWTPMRKRLPALRTLPSRRVSTSSFRPIVAASSFVRLKWNDDVRAMTRSPLILASTFRSSSARPSEKYSSSALALRFTNGSTAIEATFSDAGFAGAPGSLRSSSLRSRRSARDTSSAFWKRSRGFFSRQRLTMRSRSAGKSARTRVSGSGASRRIA